MSKLTIFGQLIKPSQCSIECSRAQVGGGGGGGGGSQPLADLVVAGYTTVSHHV